jgi:hypothetical protein
MREASGGQLVRPIRVYRRIKQAASTNARNTVAQRSVQRFHAVGGVDRLPDVHRVIEKRRDPRPVPPPTGTHAVELDVFGLNHSCSHFDAFATLTCWAPIFTCTAGSSSRRTCASATTVAVRLLLQNDFSAKRASAQVNASSAAITASRSRTMGSGKSASLKLEQHSKSSQRFDVEVIEHSRCEPRIAFGRTSE